MEQDIGNSVRPSESKIQLEKIIKASNFFLNIVIQLNEEHLTPLDKYFASVERTSPFANAQPLIFKRAFAFRHFIVEVIRSPLLQNQLCALRVQDSALELSQRFEAWQELIRNPQEPILFNEALLLAPLINQLLKIELIFKEYGLFKLLTPVTYIKSLPYLQLEVRGNGNCLFYAYGLGLIDYLRRKKDEAITHAILNKIPLLSPQEREALLDIIHNESDNLAQHTRTIEDLLGSKLRLLAVDRLRQEFLAHPKTTQLFQVALYVANQMQKGVLDNFSDLVFAETEFIRAKFFQDFQKALFETGILIEDIERFIIDYFSSNNHEKLNAYLTHLNASGQWGTDEQVHALQRAIRGEYVVGEEGHRRVLCEHEIALKIHKDMDIIEEFSDINLHNDRNVHWTPIFPSVISVRPTLIYDEVEEEFHDEFECVYLENEEKIIIQKLDKPQHVPVIPSVKTSTECTPQFEVDKPVEERVSRASSFSSQVTEKGVCRKLSPKEQALERIQKYFKLSGSFTEEDFHKALLEKLKQKIKTRQSLEKKLADYKHVVDVKNESSDSELSENDEIALDDGQRLQDKEFQAAPVSFFYLPEDKLYKAHDLSGAITSQEVRLKALMALDGKASFQSFLGPYTSNDPKLLLPVWENLFVTIIHKSAIEIKKTVARYFFDYLENNEDILCSALLAVHSKAYILSLIEQCCEAEAGSRPFKDSGMAFEASEDVMLNQNTIELCLRPLIGCILNFSSVQFILGLPSHHAQITAPNGFCFINTLMVLAHIEKSRLRQIPLRHFIVGTDVNRDNGIAAIVEKCDLENLHHIDLFDEGVFPEESLEDTAGEKTSLISGKSPKKPVPPVYEQEGKMVGYQLTPHRANYEILSKHALETNFYNQHKVYSPLALNRFTRTNLEVIHPAIETVLTLLKKEVQYHSKLVIYIPWGVDSHIEDATFDTEKMTSEVKAASRFTSKDLAYFYDELLSLYEKNREKITRIYITLEGGYDEKVLVQELQVFINKLAALNEAYYQSLCEKIEKNIVENHWDLAILHLQHLLEKKGLSKKERSSCWEKLCYCYVQNQETQNAQMAYQKMMEYKNDLSELMSFLFRLEVTKRLREEDLCSQAPPRKKVRHIGKEDFRYLQSEGENYFEKIDKVCRTLLTNGLFNWANQQLAMRCKVEALSYYELMGSIVETLAFYGLFKQTLFDELTVFSLPSLSSHDDKDKSFLSSLLTIIQWIDDTIKDKDIKVDYLKLLISKDGLFKREFVSILLLLKNDIGLFDYIPCLAKKYEEHGSVLLNKWIQMRYDLREKWTKAHLEKLLESLPSPPLITQSPAFFRQQHPGPEQEALCRQWLRN